MFSVGWGEGVLVSTDDDGYGGGSTVVCSTMLRAEVAHCVLVIWICIKGANQHSLIEQHSLGASNIGQHQEERGDMEETKEVETEKRLK